MKKLLKLVPLLAMLGSCTIVDFGGALDNVGKQVATPQTEKNSETTWKSLAYDYAPTPAWKKGDTYYVQLPIAYVPAQDWFLFHYSPSSAGGSFEYPRHLTMEEISHYPTETYYAILTQEQFEEACRHPKVELTPRMRKMKYDIVPAAEVDLTSAVKVKENTSSLPKRILLDRLPARRTTGNQWRRPLVWVLDAADIPLSVAATPIGWATNVLLYPFVKK